MITHTIPYQMEPNFTYLIAHSKGKLLMCSEYFISSQISFYAIFGENPKTGPGPKIRVFLSPGRTPVRNRDLVGPRIRPVQLCRRVHISSSLSCWEKCKVMMVGYYLILECNEPHLYSNKLTHSKFTLHNNNPSRSPLQHHIYYNFPVYTYGQSTNLSTNDLSQGWKVDCKTINYVSFLLPS